MRIPAAVVGFIFLAVFALVDDHLMALVAAPPSAAGRTDDEVFHIVRGGEKAPEAVRQEGPPFTCHTTDRDGVAVPTASRSAAPGGSAWLHVFQSMQC